MAVRNKRIFISDIHLGDNRSMNDPNHFGWFKKNIPLLAKFLGEISSAKQPIFQRFIDNRGRVEKAGVPGQLN
jgi:hypothetical protein